MKKELNLLDEVADGRYYFPPSSAHIKIPVLPVFSMIIPIPQIFIKQYFDIFLNILLKDLYEVI